MPLLVGALIRPVRGAWYSRSSLATTTTLPVTKLAQRFNCTRRQLTRLFHQQFGCSVSDLRMEIRLRRATALLRNPEITVSEVARQCGFNHLGLFRHCFKRRFGETPMEWQVAAVRAEGGRAKALDFDPNCKLQAEGLCPW
jgi:transcriptional regulator GlxA family with amidase domain